MRKKQNQEAFGILMEALKMLQKLANILGTELILSSASPDINYKMAQRPEIKPKAIRCVTYPYRRGRPRRVDHEAVVQEYLAGNVTQAMLAIKHRCTVLNISIILRKARRAIEVVDKVKGLSHMVSE